MVRHPVWKVVAITVGCLLFPLVGGSWLSNHYYRVIRQNQISAELLQAYNGADVRICGKSRLCANVDAREPQYGDKGQYRVVPKR